MDGKILKQTIPQPVLLQEQILYLDELLVLRLQDGAKLTLVAFGEKARQPLGYSSQNDSWLGDSGSCSPRKYLILFYVSWIIPPPGSEVPCLFPFPPTIPSKTSKEKTHLQNQGKGNTSVDTVLVLKKRLVETSGDVNMCSSLVSRKKPEQVSPPPQLLRCAWQSDQLETASYCSPRHSDIELTKTINQPDPVDAVGIRAQEQRK